jgi:hypothetical protein
MVRTIDGIKLSHLSRPWEDSRVGGKKSLLVAGKSFFMSGAPGEPPSLVGK